MEVKCWWWLQTADSVDRPCCLGVLLCRFSKVWETIDCCQDTAWCFYTIFLSLFSARVPLNYHCSRQTLEMSVLMSGCPGIRRQNVWSSYKEKLLTSSSTVETVLVSCKAVGLGKILLSGAFRVAPTSETLYSPDGWMKMSEMCRHKVKSRT